MTCLSNAEPSVFIEGQDGFLLTYPPNMDRGTFMVNVYTTSKVVTFDVVNADEISSDIYTIFRSYNDYEVVAKYEVGVSQLRFHRRNYSIHVANSDGLSRTQRIQILKATSECN